MKRLTKGMKVIVRMEVNKLSFFAFLKKVLYGSIDGCSSLSMIPLNKVIGWLNKGFSLFILNIQSLE